MERGSFFPTWQPGLDETMEGRDYIEIAAIAQKRRLISLPEEYLIKPDDARRQIDQGGKLVLPNDHFTAREWMIITATAFEILGQIHERQWTAVEVTKAFIKAATVAQQLVRAVFGSESCD